jgi:hypothetical protein
MVPRKEVAKVCSWRVMDPAEILLTEDTAGRSIIPMVRFKSDHIAIGLWIINLPKISDGK